MAYNSHFCVKYFVAFIEEKDKKTPSLLSFIDKYTFVNALIAKGINKTEKSKVFSVIKLVGEVFVCFIVIGWRYPVFVLFLFVWLRASGAAAK